MVAVLAFSQQGNVFSFTEHNCADLHNHISCSLQSSFLYSTQHCTKAPLSTARAAKLSTSHSTRTVFT